MNIKTVAFLGLLAVAPLAASAQAEKLEIGTISHVDSNEATTWSMSGYEVIHVAKSDGNDTPVTRTLKFDARTVEIFDRVQSPPFRPQDVRVEKHGKSMCIVVRRYILAECLPQDAAAAGVSQTALANQWAAAVRRTFVQVAPLPSRFGI